ncbi:MAG: hypothetical protein KA354_08990 [Phycisphaerae bacterium]|nr:hypothetical protein [Phycisphaerae bacterium]
MRDSAKTKEELIEELRSPRARVAELEQVRFQDNWRLREAALAVLGEVYRPSEVLVEEACRIMMDEGLYHHVRVLAAEALAAMHQAAQPNWRANAGAAGLAAAASAAPGRPSYHADDAVVQRNCETQCMKWGLIEPGDKLIL